MLLRWRKDVDDAAAYGELASPLDQVDAGVRRTDQGRREVGQVDLLADHEAYRSQVAKPFDLRLQDAAHRCDHDPRRRKITIARQPPQQLEPTADGIGARAQPLVRQASPTPGSTPLLPRRPVTAAQPSAPLPRERSS